MRTIQPGYKYVEPGTKFSNDDNHNHRLIFSFPIPLRLFRERFLFTFFVERESLADNRSVPVASWKKRLNSIIIIIAICCLLIIFATGLVYFGYLFKCRMGLDLFSNAHFFKI